MKVLTSMHNSQVHWGMPTLTIRRTNGETEQVPVTLRIDTPIEVDYYLHGGILPYVLRQLISQS